MSACERARLAISVRADGMLPPHEAAGLLRHLAGCAECRDFDRQLASVVDLLRTIRPLERRGPVPQRVFKTRQAW